MLMDVVYYRSFQYYWLWYNTQPTDRPRRNVEGYRRFYKLGQDCFVVKYEPVHSCGRRIVKGPSSYCARKLNRHRFGTLLHNTVYYWGHKLVQPSRKCPKPVTIQFSYTVQCHHFSYDAKDTLVPAAQEEIEISVLRHSSSSVSQDIRNGVMVIRQRRKTKNWLDWPPRPLV